MKKHIVMTLFSAAFLSSAFAAASDPCPQQLTAAQLQAVDTAYAESLQSIEARASELKDWYLSRKKGCSCAAAQLTDLRSMWNVSTGSEKEALHYVQKIIADATFSREAGAKYTDSAVAHAVYEMQQAEDRLAVETDCYTLSHIVAPQHTEAVTLPDGAEPLNQVTQALYTELGAQIGSEVATFLIVKGASAAGVMGAATVSAPVTFGISLVVGLAVDTAIVVIAAPEDDIRCKLEQQIDSIAEKQSSAFRIRMVQLLDERRKQWIQEIAAAEQEDE